MCSHVHEPLDQSINVEVQLVARGQGDAARWKDHAAGVGGPLDYLFCHFDLSDTLTITPVLDGMPINSLRHCTSPVAVSAWPPGYSSGLVLIRRATANPWAIARVLATSILDLFPGV
jgi:hypothetical protein